MPTRAKEKFKTYKNVFDDFTVKNLFKLISQGYFEGIESQISMGKESNVFSAVKKDGTRVIVKIYRLETCDFNRMFDYLVSDSRYMNIKHNKRKVIFAWAQREFRNLMKVKELGVNVPTPIHCYYNILIEEFIGDKSPALKLKDSIPEKPKIFLNKIIRDMKKLYLGGYVHSDLSKFNVLNFNESPVLIDFSQCTTKRDTRFSEFLMRDAKNIADFFRKIGVNVTQEEIIKKIKTKKI